MLIAWNVSYFSLNTGDFEDFLTPLHATRFYNESLRLNEVVTLGNISLSFFVNTPVYANEPTTFSWQVEKKEAEGKLTLTRVMHNVVMHVYAISHDLSTPLLHEHPVFTPSDKLSGTFFQTLTFPREGLWYITAQITEGDTLYQVSSEILVGDRVHSTVSDRDFSREKKSKDLHVRLETNKRIVKNRPTHLYLYFEDPFDPNYKLYKNKSISGHNLIFIHHNSPLIWNEHQDGSVVPLSFVGVGGVRLSKRILGDKYFGYDAVEFSQSGVWLVRYEFSGDPVEFYLTVEE